MENLKNRIRKMAPDSYLQSNVIVAMLLIAIGLGFNPTVLGSILDVSFSLQEKLLIIAFEVFIILTGIAIFLKGDTNEGRKYLAFSFVGILLVLVVIEGGLHIIDFVASRVDSEDGLVTTKSRLSPYSEEEWAEGYWEEINEHSLRYAPFLGWHSEEYKGEYVNVDSNGLRKSWAPKFKSESIRDSVYVFGGSTVWGYGSRDDYTIPSHISKMLNENNHSYDVYNCGEWAYTFTQEMMQLMLLLKDGHRPDYVIFYDGGNDVYAAYQSGVPGYPHNVGIIQEKFKQVSHHRTILRELRDIFEEDFMIYKVLGKIADVISPKEEFQETAANYDDDELQFLADSIVDSYLDSVVILDSLAQTYDFEYICYWQPITFTEENLLKDEAESDQRINDQALRKLYMMTADSITTRSPANVIDLTGVLSERSVPIYIDFIHVSEQGNEVISTEIIRLFEQAFLAQDL